MKRFATLIGGLLVLLSFSQVFAQDFVRKELDVPKVDPAAITIDANMNESEWNNAAQVNLITSAGYEIFANKYYRENLVEPEYDEFFARVLWAKDSIYLFITIDEFVNDSTNLYWNGKWTGDQLFVSFSNRLAREMQGWYDGNSYAAPDGPYHLWILGDEVTLNGGDTTYIPEEYRGCFEDSQKVFMASDFARWAVSIDTVAGLWKIEMAVHNPNADAYGRVGFNIGGSTGSRQSDEEFGDAYGYFTWQPNVPNDPFGDPYGNGDPGYYNLANSEYWAVLKFTPGNDDIVRKVVNVSTLADPTTLVMDGNMNEAAWQTASTINLISSAGYEFFANKYYREDLLEPEYDEFYAKVLWAEDTLYLFIVIDEFVNDSTNLYWNGKWTGDQLFVSLSNRIARDMKGWYDGNSYAAPDGPYHFWILGDDVTLNGGDTTYVPDEYRLCFDQSDSLQVFDPADFSRWGITIDTLTGMWHIEMAIYNPHVTAQSEIAFNIGGSTGSRQSDEEFGDAYGYFTWQPNIPNDPFGDPYGNGDPGFYNLANSEYWGVLTFSTGLVGVGDDDNITSRPDKYYLHQNYPNPFNPTTNIRFDVVNSAPVSIKIYNSLGQLVTTLVDSRTFSPGTYTVNWNATNMASGIYFVEFKSDKVVQSRKMMLVK
jgi:hypothetical protein